MIIGIDASRAARKKRTGTENYSYYLIKYMLQTSSEARFILYTRKKLPHEIRSLLNERITEKIIDGQLLWSQFTLARAARKDKLDVLFVPSHVVSFLYRKKTVVTVHGLEYEKTPYAFPFFDRMYLRLTTRYGATHSKRVIVPSEHTKKDLKSYYDTPSSKISVIRHGSIAKEIKKSNTSLSCFEKKQPYFFFIGRLEERKNIKRILRAFFQLKNDPRYASVQLIMAGSITEYFTKECKGIIENSVYAKDVVIRGYVTDAEYYCYLKNASALLFPSLSEGFGMPVLDAQYLDVPVITSKNSPMEEICSTKCALVAPFEIKSIARGMRNVLDDSRLDSNETQLSFSWKETAKQTLSVLEKASK